MWGPSQAPPLQHLGWIFCLVISIQDFVISKALLIPAAELLVRQCHLGMESLQFVLIPQAFYTHCGD